VSPRSERPIGRLGARRLHERLVDRLQLRRLAPAHRRQGQQGVGRYDRGPPALL